MIRKKTKFFSLLVIIGMISISFLFSSCGKRDESKLVVGMELKYPPFETTDANNNPAGLSVDLAKELGEYLDKEVIIENLAWSGLIPSLESGKIDIIISSMTINEERRKTIDFSEPYASTGLALLINADSDVYQYDDLKESGKILAVKRGTSGHLYAQENLPEENIMIFDNEGACVLEVVQGKADAFTYDQLTIYRNWLEHESTTRINLERYQEQPDFWGIGVSKKNPELTSQINDFIEVFRSSGGFDRLAESHLSEEKNTFDSLGIPFFFDIK